MDENERAVQPEPMGLLQLYAVGFLVEGRDAHGRGQTAAGSGVLVDLDGLRGVLTAGHVARALEAARGNLGLFTVTGSSSQRAPQLQFPSSSIRCVRVGGDQEKPEGPDLGFVRLPHGIETQLGVRHSFYSFRRRWNSVAAATNPLIGDVIVGAVGEKVMFKRRTPDVRVDERTMDLATGKVTAERLGDDGYDIFDFEVEHDDRVRRPKSYGGMSGSAVWRIGETSDANDRLILGIAFYESEPRQDGNSLITCHGPDGLYQKFLPMVQAARDSGALK